MKHITLAVTPVITWLTLFLILNENARCGFSCSHQTVSNLFNLSLKWCVLMNAATCKCCMWSRLAESGPGHIRVKIPVCEGSQSNHPHMDTCGLVYNYFLHCLCSCFSSTLLHAFNLCHKSKHHADNKAAGFLHMCLCAGLRPRHNAIRQTKRNYSHTYTQSHWLVEMDGGVRTKEYLIWL